MSLLSKSLLVVANKVGGIVKILDIVPFIPFKAVPGPAYEILNCVTSTFFYCLFVKQMVYLKGSGGVGVIVNKYGGGHIRTWAMKRIIGWEWR